MLRYITAHNCCRDTVQNAEHGNKSMVSKRREKMLVFTVRRSLHGICYSNSVRPSVRPSVCHTRGLCPHGSTYDHDFFTIW